MQFFATPLRNFQQTTPSLRSRQYKPFIRKRKREDDDDEDDEEEEAEHDPISSRDDAKELLLLPPPPPPSSTAPSFASSPPPQDIDAAQLRVAGLLPDQLPTFEIPPAPFPHAPARLPRQNFTSAKVHQELARLDPPLFAVNPTPETSTSTFHPGAGAPTLRHAHVGVLTTLMHRCLLDGDYQRAGRAWGMILRSYIAGLPIDPRNNHRWGVGAEILLRRDPQQPDQDHPYSDKGFELAREYYERLIVQYPHRRHHPHTVDERTFYPAMFSLWIYEVCEKTRRAKSNLEERAHPSMDDDTDMAMGATHAHLADLRAEELGQAKEIMQRLDNMIVYPPFDKHADLLQMRGMVGLWVGDLILGDLQPETGERSLAAADFPRGDAAADMERRRSMSRRELAKSLDFLQRAQLLGKHHLDSTIYTVRAMIKELDKTVEGSVGMHT